MTLPDWLDPLWEAEEMRAADAYAIEQAGVPSLELMDRAGLGLARVAVRMAGDGPIRIVVGKGNNGGDGLAAARFLREEGRAVDVLTTGDPSELKGDAAASLERLPGERPRAFEPAALDGSALVIDALLGTGFEGAPREPLAGAIAAINECGAPVLACDVPSGVNASTGEVAGEAVRAAATATFHGPKAGLWIEPGKSHVGELEVVDIGIPRGAPPPRRLGVIAERTLRLVPPRERSGNKFESGTVVVVGGARGLTGAPIMAALSAMRAGAGYVQVAVPGSVETVFDLRLLEAMTHALPDAQGAHVEEGAAKVEELAERAGAMVLGPGIGRSDGAVAFARRVARAVDVPLLIDADGLNAHAEQLESLAGRDAPTVLTPHDGELGRLLGIDSSEVGERRLHHAREAARRSRAIVVLKGDDTLVVPPEGPVGVNSTGTPALASAGTGDVLSGLVGTLLAKGMEPFEAACAGVLAHGRAGRAAAARLGADHVIASDVIENLPRGMRLTTSPRG